jgi:Tfp pilus assembly protein PilF
VAAIVALVAFLSDSAESHARAATQGAITFARDVEPIVRSRCTPCHRPEGPAPFALETHADVARRGRLIARVVETGYMPPWLPEQGSETFAGARRLTAEERDTIVRWAEQGMAAGEPKVEREATKADEPNSNDRPDLMVEVDAPYTLPADGPDVFRNFVLRVPLERARYVRAVRIDPGEARVVHHASLGVDRTRTARRLDALSAEPGFSGMLAGGAASPPGHFIGWAPGRQAYRSPPGLSWRLDAGADLVLQMHMVPSGAAEPIRPRVALFFTEEAPRARAGLVRLGSTGIDIPPGMRRHVLEDTFELPVGVAVLGISPHAHYLAREIESVATLPGGRRVPLLTIMAWNFRWQDDYRYLRPLELPAGTRITTRVVYDNTSNNHANPHQPPRRVVYGPSSGDEMGDVWLQVVPDSASAAAQFERIAASREIAAQSDGYRRLASALPEDPVPRFTLATLYMQAGRLHEAMAELDRVLSIAPTWAMALYNRGVALQRAGRLTESARDFLDALARDPRYAEAEHALGHVRLAQGNRRDAERHFSNAVAVWPAFADGWNSLATLRASRDALDEAIECYRRALTISPEHREALNNLGILLARRGRLAEATALLERAVAAYPEDEASRQNLAAATQMKRR